MSSSCKINSRMFNNFVGKHNDIGDVVKIPREFKNKTDVLDDGIVKRNKNYESKNRDRRYANKNKRTINKDWKDFNNIQ